MLQGTSHFSTFFPVNFVDRAILSIWLFVSGFWRIIVFTGQRRQSYAYPQTGGSDLHPGPSGPATPPGYTQFSHLLKYASIQTLLGEISSLSRIVG